MDRGTEHDSKLSGTAGDWDVGKGRQGGGRTLGQRNQVEGGSDPWKGSPIGYERDLGSV